MADTVSIGALGLTLTRAESRDDDGAWEGSTPAVPQVHVRVERWEETAVDGEASVDSVVHWSCALTCGDERVESDWEDAVDDAYEGAVERARLCAPRLLREVLVAEHAVLVERRRKQAVTDSWL